MAKPVNDGTGVANSLGPSATGGKLSAIARHSRGRRQFLQGSVAALSASALPRVTSAAASLLPSGIEEIFSTLSLEEKIGQLLMVGISGQERTAETSAMLKELKPGAIILLGRNVRDPAQLTTFAAALQEGARVTRFVSMDQEGGTVVRLLRGATVFPGAMATGATGSSGLARLEGRVSGAELSALGVNMNLAPVLDVNSNRKNPVIGVRAFGDDPMKVAMLSVAYALGLQDSGVSAVAKHFPGHGDSVEDSHRGLPTIKHDLARLQKVELVPFAAAAKAGVDAMMTAHLLFPAIDDVPATLSKKILTDILRGQLGFQGMVISDDLEMKAVEATIGVGPCTVRSILAGADQVMIIWHRTNKDIARNALLAAVKSGELPMARVDEAVRRVLSVKARRGIIPLPGTIPSFQKADAAAIAAVGNPHHRRVAREIAKRAITLVWNRAGALPCTPAAAARLVVMSASDDFLAEMRAVRPGSIEIHLPNKPDDAARGRVAALASRMAGRADRFVITVANAEQALLARAVADLLGMRVPVVGVALGAPYLLDDAERVAAHVCAYSSRPDSLRAVSRVVAGLDQAGGIAPVQLSAR